MNRSMAMPTVSRTTTPTKGLRWIVPVQAVSRDHRRMGWAGSAAKGFFGNRRGEVRWMTASATVLRRRSPARAVQTRPLRSQAWVVLALAVMRGDRCAVMRAVCGAAWDDMCIS